MGTLFKLVILFLFLAFVVLLIDNTKAKASSLLCTMSGNIVKLFIETSELEAKIERIGEVRDIVHWVIKVKSAYIHEGTAYARYHRESKKKKEMTVGLINIPCVAISDKKDSVNNLLKYMRGK